MSDQPNPVRVQQVETFINAWRIAQVAHAPLLKPLEIAAALENVAEKIRQEEAQKANSQN